MRATTLPAMADHRVPLALCEIHRAMAVGSSLHLVVFADGSSAPPAGIIWRGSEHRLVDVVVGAGFTNVALDVAEAAEPPALRLSAIRGRSLPDVVGPGMRMLMCGLNPSIFAADAGVGFARPGNRFWPAMRAAGLSSVDRDATALLAKHRIGMTDIAKRATVSAEEVSAEEYASGIERVERLCEWLEPELIYFVGLQGWRTAVDPRATPGPQTRTLGGVPVYLGPSTSGLNAHAQLKDHVAHLRAAESWIVPAAATP